MSSEATQSENGLEVKSAFTLVYFIGFIYTLYTVGSEMPTLFPTIEAATIDQKVFYHLCYGYVIVVGIHLCRIYLHLEMMEAREGIFENFYDSFSSAASRIFEFIARLIIVLVITFKAIEAVGGDKVSQVITSFDSIPLFLLFVYGALIFWSLIAMILGQKTWRDAFLFSSFAGFIAAFLLSKGIADIGKLGIIAAALVIFAVCIYLVYDLWVDGKANFKKYVDFSSQAIGKW